RTAWGRQVPGAGRCSRSSARTGRCTSRTTTWGRCTRSATRAEPPTNPRWGHNVGMRTPEEYRESLRDGRRIFYRGQKVDDVTTHPVLRTAIDHAAIDYAMAHDPTFRELAVAEEGWSRYFSIPRSAEDLLRRSRLVEAGTR